MAATGGRVLALRSVEFARNHNVPLHVRSSFTWEPGTWVDKEDASPWSRQSSPPSPTTCPRPRSPSPGCPTGRAWPPSCSAAWPTGNINVDMIVQNISLHGTTDISFTIPEADLAVSTEVCEGLVPELGATGVISDDDVARVSLVGVGMKTHPGVTALTFETLAAAGHQHRDDLDLVDPDLVPDPAPGRPRTRCAPCTPPSSWPDRAGDGRRPGADRPAGPLP